MIKKVLSRIQSVLSEESRKISERHRQITTFWQSIPIIGKVLILISLAIIIPFLFALVIPLLLTLAFVTPAIFLIHRWISILASDYFNTGAMKVPTFYSTSRDGDEVTYILFMSVVGGVFGGIHCAGWFFHFPSSYEAMLWRVSSAILTGVAFLLPLLFYFILETSSDIVRWVVYITAVLSFIAYVVSRLILLVEAFISLRHLTPGMLTLVKWTSILPHI